MKKLLVSILIVLSIYNHYVKEEYKKIPVITIISRIENNQIIYDEKALKKVIYDDVATFYQSTSKGKLTLYNPMDEKLNRIRITEEYNYGDRKIYGLKSIKEAKKSIDYKSFDLNNNQVIESDELIIINILETKDTYDQPIASTIQLENFFIEDIKIEKFIQLGIREVFSKRESLLTPSTVAHEIGHYFGLPDLYDTDYSSKGLGPMSLMSEIHSDQPINFDPWSKLNLGIAKSFVIKASGIHKIEKGKIYLVKTNNNWIYYLIERRSFNGYDESLSNVMLSDGVFIYKIDEKVINETIEFNHVNRDEKRMGVEFLGNEVRDEEHDVYLKGIDSNHLLIEN